MPSLSELFDSLGIKQGQEGINHTKPKPRKSFATELGGKVTRNPHGETLLIEQDFPLGYLHGHYELSVEFPLDGLSLWSGIPDLPHLSSDAFAFLDTETTGLSGGTGTFAFLIGVGKFDHAGFHIAQWFLRDPIEESAQLYALEEFLAGCQAVVTYNGKTFDLPLLNTRYTAHGWESPLKELHHLDLLHLARRLWRNRLPSRTLANLEVQILGSQRTDEDIPGWMIPSLYFEFIREKDPEPIKGVLYHNAMDVLSLAVLMNRMAHLLSNPIEVGNQYGVDLIALAKLFEDLNSHEKAVELYLHALSHEDAVNNRIPEELILDSLYRLSIIYKRNQEMDQALRLWEQAADHQHIQAHIELAKYYEHQRKDFEKALSWTERAIQHIEATSSTLTFTIGPLENHWLQKLIYRKERLVRKINRNTEK